jgi:hypothetical protein
MLFQNCLHNIIFTLYSISATDKIEQFIDSGHAPSPVNNFPHLLTGCFKCGVDQGPSQAQICKSIGGEKNIIFIKLTVPDERKDESFNLSCQNKGSMFFKHAFISFMHVPFFYPSYRHLLILPSIELKDTTFKFYSGQYNACFKKK